MLPCCEAVVKAPEAGASVSQEAAGETLALQCRGQVQLPVPVNVTNCASGFAPPAMALKRSVLCDGGARVQGGWTVRFTETVCGLPLAGEPRISVAKSVIWPG